MKSKIFALLTVLLIGILLISCSKNNMSTEPVNLEEGVVLSGKAVIIEDSKLSKFEIEGDTYKLTYLYDQPEIEVGDVIVGQKDEGYLRKVISITNEDNKIIMETEQARLTDVIEQCKIQETINLSLDNMEVTYLAEGVSLDRGSMNFSGLKLYEGTVGSAHLTAKIANGSVEFEPSFHTALDIGWFKINHYKLTTSGDLDFNCDLQLNSNNPVSYSKEKLIANFVSSPFLIGPVPMIANISFVVGFDTDHDAGCEVNAGFDVNSTVEFGAEYYKNSGWSTIWNKSVNQNGHPIGWDLNGDADARCYITPKISVKVAGVAGPYMEVEPYLYFDGVLSYPNWQWELAGGFDGNLGFDVSIFGYTIADYYTNLYNWETTISNGSGSLKKSRDFKTIDF